MLALGQAAWIIYRFGRSASSTPWRAEDGVSLESQRGVMQGGAEEEPRKEQDQERSPERKQGGEQACQGDRGG